MTKGGGESMGEERKSADAGLGIVVTDRPAEVAGDGTRPRIAAFIWGGKVRPTPTLPYGRWKGAA